MSTVTTLSLSPLSSVWRGKTIVRNQSSSLSLLSFSSIAIHLLTKLNKETEHFKRNVSSKGKTKTKKVNAVKSRIKKKEKEIKKLRKVGGNNNATPDSRLNSTTRELYLSYQDLEELEEKYFQDLNETEEQYLTLTLNTLESVFKEEIKLYRNNECLNTILGIIQQVKQGTQGEKEDQIEEREEEADVQIEAVSDEDEVLPGAEDALERGQSVMETSVMGSRTGSFLSLSSVASFSYREDGQTQQKQQMFSTIKRCHSPFRKPGSVPSHQPRRRESRRRLDGTKHPLPPLPPLHPLPRPHVIQTDDSLSHLRQKLEDISLSPLLVPRSPYMEDNSMDDLHQKLKFLSMTTTKHQKAVDSGKKRYRNQTN